MHESLNFMKPCFIECRMNVPPNLVSSHFDSSIPESPGQLSLPGYPDSRSASALYNLMGKLS